MKKAYFGISLSKRPEFDQEIELIKKILATHQIDLWVFVDHYHFSSSEEKIMMKQACKDIDASDFLIVEMSKKAVGVGIEVGYAFAKNKPILYLKKREAPYSTTTGGCASFFIDYEEIDDLSSQLIKAIPSLLKS